MLANSEVSMVLSVIDVTGRDNCHAGYDVITFDTSIRLSPRQRLFQGTIRLQCISVGEACAQGIIRPSCSRDQERGRKIRLQPAVVVVR